jgi:hypothetical protein
MQLDEVHLVVQLYSYPATTLRPSRPVERMAETIEKFEEDVYDDYAPPKGKRRAAVTFGEPIDLKSFTAAGTKARAAAGELTYAIGIHDDVADAYASRDLGYNRTAENPET